MPRPADVTDALHCLVPPKTNKVIPHSRSSCFRRRSRRPCLLAVRRPSAGGRSRRRWPGSRSPEPWCAPPVPPPVAPPAAPPPPPPPCAGRAPDPTGGTADPATAAAAVGAWGGPGTGAGGGGGGAKKTPAAGWRRVSACRWVVGCPPSALGAGAVGPDGQREGATPLPVAPAVSAVPVAAAAAAMAAAAAPAAAVLGGGSGRKMCANRRWWACGPPYSSRRSMSVARQGKAREGVRMGKRQRLGA